MPISDFVKHILHKYGIPQTQSHIDRVCRFLRENNPTDSKWSEDSNLKLPTKDEVLRLFCVSAKPCQEVEAEGGHCSISFICQDTENSKDTIYDKVLSYFDLSEEIEPDIQKIFLNGALFPDIQSKRCLLVPSMLKLNEPSFGTTQIATYDTSNNSFVIGPSHLNVIEISDFGKIINKTWVLFQPAIQEAMTNLISNSGLVDNKDIAEATGKAGVFLVDRLLQALQEESIQIGETKPMWVKSNKIQNRDKKIEGTSSSTIFDVTKSDLGISYKNGLVKMAPTLAVQMTLLLNNSRKMTFELRVSDFLLATLDTHPINFEASFSFPMIELWFRIY